MNENFGQKEPLKDGQHQHGHQQVTLMVDRDGMMKLALHLAGGKCPAHPTPLDPDATVPIHLELESEDKTLATIICGACMMRLGQCKVKQCSDQQGS